MKRTKPLKTQIFRKLGALYTRMDTAYVQAAEGLDLSCSGCADNCCRTHFQHHTYIEWAYLWKGLSAMDQEQVDRFVGRAREAVEESRWLLAAGERPRIMCPLNQGGLCAVYESRLMICRLHGVPNHFQLPNGTVRRFPGCFRAQEISSGLPQPPSLDRTQFYRDLAALEQAFVGKKRSFLPRVDLTLAEMLVQGPPPV